MMSKRRFSLFHFCFHGATMWRWTTPLLLLRGLSTFHPLSLITTSAITFHVTLLKYGGTKINCWSNGALSFRMTEMNQRCSMKKKAKSDKKSHSMIMMIGWDIVASDLMKQKRLRLVFLHALSCSFGLSRSMYSRQQPVTGFWLWCALFTSIKSRWRT